MDPYLNLKWAIPVTYRQMPICYQVYDVKDTCTVVVADLTPYLISVVGCGFRQPK